jgi:ATP-binding cassette, subfamily B, bacterial
VTSRTRKFFSYYKPYRRLLFVDLTCAALVSATTLLLPLCSQYVIKSVLAGAVPDTPADGSNWSDRSDVENRAQITRISNASRVVAPPGRISLTAGLMFALVVAHVICNTFVDYRGHVMGSLMERDMRNELFDHYQRLSFSFYDHKNTGQLMTHITTDLMALSEFYHHGPEDLVIGVLKLAGVSVILLCINATLGLMTIIFLSVMSVYAFHFNRKMNAALRASRARVGDINAQVEDTLAGIRVVQSFANEDVEKRLFAGENERFVATRRDGYRSEACFCQGMVAFTQLLTVAVVVLGAAAIANGFLDAADLVTYLLCIGVLIEPVQRLVNFARVCQEGIVGFKRFMDALEAEPDVCDSAGAVDLVEVRGQIEFRRVSFKYQEDQEHVVRNVCLDIGPGECVAVVGRSGVGKTTLCSLIPRFYDATEGAVLLDGKDVRNLTLRSLRRNVGIVQQDVYLFARTVADNIRYGKPGASDEEVIAAAKKANAHDFIVALPEGYDTYVGQRAVRLSGGQKQRLCIARVFLKDPPVVIFDEATSALDYESETAVQRSLETLASNRTTLVIAHRLSTIRNARRIVVLSDDGIDEQGTHEELLSLNGVYAKLYSTQNLRPDEIDRVASPGSMSNLRSTALRD